MGTRADGRVACCALGSYRCSIGGGGGAGRVVGRPCWVGGLAGWGPGGGGLGGGAGGEGGLVGRNVSMAQKGVHVCGVKNALQTV